MYHVFVEILYFVKSSENGVMPRTPGFALRFSRLDVSYVSQP